MVLYDPFETKTSFGYLEKVVNILEEPICLLGGWGVYLTVNEEFRVENTTNYHGSRDIDLGFHIDSSLNEKDLSKSTIKKAIDVLINNGFEPERWHYYKIVEYGTNKELSLKEAEKKQTHDIFKMYVDPIVDYVHPSFKKFFNFDPIDEPFLTQVFENKTKRKELKKFKKLLWLPTADVLLATKIKSSITRSDDKYTKDICDIYAVCWYSDITFRDIIAKVHEILDKKYFHKLIERINQDRSVFHKAEIAIGIDAEIISNTLEELCS